MENYTTITPANAQAVFQAAFNAKMQLEKNIVFGSLEVRTSLTDDERRAYRKIYENNLEDMRLAKLLMIQ